VGTSQKYYSECGNKKECNTLGDLEVEAEVRINLNKTDRGNAIRSGQRTSDGDNNREVHSVAQQQERLLTVRDG
jgi:hypothetical protein